MKLVSVTAYHSFGGEVEASNTPTIRRLTPSCRHQLPRIAPRVSDSASFAQLLVTLSPLKTSKLALGRVSALGAQEVPATEKKGPGLPGAIDD